MEVNIIIFLQSFSSRLLDMIMIAQSYIASWIGLLFLFAVIILFVDKKFGITFGCGFLLTIGINYLIKTIVNRPRPFETHTEIINKLSTIGKSFPSGHTVSATFMVLSILFLLYIMWKKGKLKSYSKKWVRIISVILSALFVVFTAISRMYLGQHYLTDIIGGLFVAVLGFVCTYFVYKKISTIKNNKASTGN